jgi:voltage-gated sodium channel
MLPPRCLFPSGGGDFTTNRLPIAPGAPSTDDPLTLSPRRRTRKNPRLSRRRVAEIAFPPATPAASRQASFGCYRTRRQMVPVQKSHGAVGWVGQWSRRAAVRDGDNHGELPGWRADLRAFLERRWIQNGIIALIVINAITLGLETSPTAMAAAGPTLLAIDRTILVVFVVEIALRLIAWGGRFFRDPWSVFDLVVVGVAMVPATNGLSVLRSLRILRVLRLISVVPRMRRVVSALLGAIPGMGSIIALMCLLMYVAAVMATKLYGPSFPELFGSIGASLFTLFQIMTLEGWSDGVVRPIAEVYPYSLLFFIPFILITTFIMLNLFVAVIVGAMQSEHEAETASATKAAHDDQQALLAEVRALRAEIGTLRAAGPAAVGDEPRDG